MISFRQKFEQEMVPNLKVKLGVKNVFALPRIVKIVVNSSLKEYQDKKVLAKACEEFAIITGQKPKTTKARLSIASFKLRQGEDIGIVVTLRGKRMYDFFEKLVTIVLPRVRDFAGIDPDSFDQGGNLTIGFTEQTVFPEIDPGKVEKIMSLQTVIVTNSKNRESAKVLLEAMGVPFRK